MDEPLGQGDDGTPASLGTTGPIKVECLVRDDFRIAIRPAPQERDWMNVTPQQFAYRCLPLNIANAHNWEVLGQAGFRAPWNGGPRVEDITVEHDEPDGPVAAMSHFGSGVLTIPVAGLFRTDPGYDLWVMGPVNRPKADIQALSAVVETDWLPFTFTMNWIFTRPDQWVRFDKDEPVCAFFPVPRGLIERCAPAFGRMDDDPDVAGRFEAYRESRLKFNDDLKVTGSEARAEKWQKTYFRGPDAPLDAPHRTKLRAKPFEPRE